MNSGRKIESNIIESTGIFVDVDKTLLLGMDGHYNIDLINALKATGHNKIYLFTSMTMWDITQEIASLAEGLPYSSRPKLIEYLKREHNIDVMAVMTPADVVYSKDSKEIGATYRDLFLKHHKRIGKELNIETFRTDESFQKDSEKYKKCHNEACRPDQPGTGKSRLYEYGIARIPRISSCIVIDDSINDLNAIDEIKSEAVTSTTCIAVKKDSKQDYFEKMIYAHSIGTHIGIKILKDESPDDYLNKCVSVLNKNARTAFEQKNYDAACKNLEMIYIIGGIIKLTNLRMNDLLNNIQIARESARLSKNQFFDNLLVDQLYTYLLKYQMGFRKLQLKIDLYKISNSKKYFSGVNLFFSQSRSQEHERDLLNPFRAFVHKYPDKIDECLELFKQIQACIPEKIYNDSVNLINKAATDSMKGKLNQSIKVAM